ncbi:hypothetical protein N658DRAFT_499980 [Parathielavia hyrcaniae]|uniref:Uncharacterized protein n=1 Tax=Parathielavia hyrcaniae TaxID=113614 RepID=A0AAN6PVL9_9PEZI|nr:hypothetical protein N658DRAFT_499980 [Parathielavia hyrcaniae]
MYQGAGQRAILQGSGRYPPTVVLIILIIFFNQSVAHSATPTSCKSTSVSAFNPVSVYGC